MTTNGQGGALGIAPAQERDRESVAPGSYVIEVWDLPDRVKLPLIEKLGFFVNTFDGAETLVYPYIESATSFGVVHGSVKRAYEGDLIEFHFFDGLGLFVFESGTRYGEDAEEEVRSRVVETIDQGGEVSGEPQSGPPVVYRHYVRGIAVIPKEDWLASYRQLDEGRPYAIIGRQKIRIEVRFPPPSITPPKDEEPTTPAEPASKPGSTPPSSPRSERPAARPSAKKPPKQPKVVLHFVSGDARISEEHEFQMDCAFVPMRMTGEVRVYFLRGDALSKWVYKR